MERSQLLQKIKKEFELWNERTKKKKKQRSERLEKYIKQDRKDWLININMIYNTIDALIAGSYIEEPQVKFMSRDELMEVDQAETLDNMAKFDMKEMDYQMLDYQVQRDRYFFGLGIAYNSGFQLTQMAPEFYSISPMSVILDPYPANVWKYTSKNYRFVWFVMESNIDDLKADRQYNKEALKQMVRSDISADVQSAKKAVSKASNLEMVVEDLDLNYTVEVYHHFTVVDWRKMLYTVDNRTKSLILREIELPASTEEEKKDPSLIPRPFSFYFYKPERGKDFGISIPDLLEDKEKSKTILINAALLKARYEAMGGKFIVNSRLINNPDDILKPSTWPLYIFTNDKLQPWEPIGNVMQELPVSPIKQDTLTMSNLIEREWVMDTKLDQMQMGIVPDKSMTKAEQQAVQSNNNVLSSLNMKTYLWGAYDFRYLWWRSYMQNFSASNKKFITMGVDFEIRGNTITRDMFLTKQNPYIVVGNRADMSAMKEKNKAYWNAMLPIITQDPTIKDISKLIVKRYVAKLNDMPKSMINQVFDLTAHERKAQSFIDNFLNDDVVPKSLFADPNADFFTYWVYFQKAKPTEAREKVLDVLQQYLIDHWGIVGTQWDMWWLANSSANILNSNLLQEQRWWLVSRDTVLPSID